MSDETRILATESLPPLTLYPSRSHRIRHTDILPRLGRLTCVLVALALPALGIAAADTVHRAGATGAKQAAARVVPTDGAAAPIIRVASLEHPQVRP